MSLEILRTEQGMGDLFVVIISIHLSTNRDLHAWLIPMSLGVAHFNASEVDVQTEKVKGTLGHAHSPFALVSSVLSQSSGHVTDMIPSS